MLESVLIRRQAGTKQKIAARLVVSCAVIALAVILPQLVHLALGAQGGMQWLPMYLPVLLGGCLLGWKWGMGVGLLAPAVSFALTSLGGNAMPAASRLPYMLAELAVFAAVSGAFSARIAENGWMAFPAVLLGQVSGRAFFLLLAALFQGVSPLSAALAWSQVVAGLVGMVAQAVAVPFLVMGLRELLLHEKRDK